MSIALKKGDFGTLVSWVQIAINSRSNNQIKVDYDFGKITEASIKEIQETFGLKPDGIVGKKTAEKLALSDLQYFEKKVQPNSNNKRISFLLPASGIGYNTYNREPRTNPVGIDQFATKQTIETIEEIGKEWYEISPDSPMLVGDISYLYGADTPDHRGHETGREVDFRLFRKDKKNAPTVYTWKSFDRDKTREFFVLLKNKFGVSKNQIYFNDKDLRSEGMCKYMPGHSNHWHINF